jgi:hypothetical protein
MLLGHLIKIGLPKSLEVVLRGVALEQHTAIAVRRYGIINTIDSRRPFHIHIDGTQALAFIIKEKRLSVAMEMESLHITAEIIDIVIGKSAYDVVPLT